MWSSYYAQNKQQQFPQTTGDLVTQKCCVSFQAVAEFLNIIQMNTIFEALSSFHL
jgi:hypothetical protein